MKYSTVKKSAEVFLALDLIGSEAELGRRLDLECGHVVYRRIAGLSSRGPDGVPVPKRVACEVCAGEPLMWRPADDVQREYAQSILRRQKR